MNIGFAIAAPTTQVAAVATPPPDRLREAAEDFEAVYLSTVIGRMFENLPTDGPFGGGHAEATYRAFLADEYAAEIARGGGIGIADAVYGELLKLQEDAGNDG